MKRKLFILRGDHFYTKARILHVLPRASLALLLIVTLVIPITYFGGLNQPVLAETTNSSALSTGNAAGAGNQSTTSTSSADAKKDEVIYGMLSGNGAVKHGYVVNHFAVEKQGTITDYGNYDTVSNLSSTQALSSNLGSVTIPVDAGDFYYQGVLTKMELPWIINIEYKLNGTIISPEQLAGKSGELAISIKTSQNSKADPVFFENYLLQVQLTLDSAKTKNLQAAGATVASAGKDQQVAFMVMPKKNGDLNLTAQVQAFEMPSIQISGVPFSMVFDTPDTSGIVDDMSELTDAISALNDGVAELKDGMKKLQDGSSELKSGSGELKTALTTLSSSGKQLKTAAKEIDKALIEISKQLNSGGVDPEKITELVDGLKQMAKGLSNTDPNEPGLAEGLGQIQGGIDSSVSAMESYMAELAIVDAASLAGLLADPGLTGLSANSQATVQKLVDTNTKAAYVLGAWYGPNGNDGVKAGLSAASAGLTAPKEAAETMSSGLDTIAESLNTNLSSLSGLSELASAMEQLSSQFTTFKDGIGTYADGVSTLSKNYGTFDSGLKQYINGADSIYNGVSTLNNGTDELYINTKDLPQTMQDEIDSFMKDYKASDFELKSFMSDKNTNVEHVQFVLVSDAIEIPEEETQVVEAEPAEQNIWDRFLALFK